MLIDTVLRAARILQFAPGYSMSLRCLHAQLVRELGPGAGTYGEIYQQLKKRTDSFIIVDGARVLGGADTWPGGVREAYDSALEHAGLGSCIRVSLTSSQEGEHSAFLATLGTTVAELTTGAAGDPTLQPYVESVAHQFAELNRVITNGETAHPTILPPDPPLSA